MRKTLVFCISLFLLLPQYTLAEGFIGENPGLNFYTRIDETAGTIATGIAKKRIEEYKTFAGFGRHCRPAMPWLDTERLNVTILNEIYSGYWGSIIDITERKRVTMTQQSLANLVACLNQTYKEIQLSSITQYENLASAGNMWLYSDGDTLNSDYDIIVDIEKINGLIFTEEIRYWWALNNGKSSLANLLAGRVIAPLITPSIQNELNIIHGQSGSTTSGTIAQSGTIQEAETTLWNLGIWEICTSDTSVTRVDNMIDDTFLDELSIALGWNGGTTGGNGYNYGGMYGANNNWTGAWNSGSSLTSNGDFFHTPRCESIFCIKVKMIGTSTSGLGGSKNDSIEGILDKHINHLEPISWTDLGLQKMTNNQFQIPFTGLSLKLKAKVKWGGIFIGSKPTPKNDYKKEETKDVKDAKFEQTFRCALYTAGFSSSNPNMVNSVIGAGYVDRIGKDTTNNQNTATPLVATNPEELNAYKNCVPIAQWRADRTYYDSIGNDLSELMTFTDAMWQEIFEILGTGEKIDTLKVKK